MRAHRPLADRTLNWHEGVAGPRERLRASAWAAVQAALAATLAWFVAHRLLGHPQPFFAPIAAAVAMSVNYFGRGRRAVQMVIGVLLGIAIAESMLKLFGANTVVLGVTVLITMWIALVVGAGFIGEGPMFVNQAAGSAILVVALQRHGTGAERAVDALVGGGVALLVGLVPVPGGAVAAAVGGRARAARVAGARDRTRPGTDREGRAGAGGVDTGHRLQHPQPAGRPGRGAPARAGQRAAPPRAAGGCGRWSPPRIAGLRALTCSPTPC